MGCLIGLIDLCRKRKDTPINMEAAPNNDLKLPLNIEENENNNNDLKEKKELAVFLIKNDLNIYNSLLSIVQEFNDEQFNQMFEGNTDYPNFNIPSGKEKFMLQLVTKFDHNRELIFEYYNQKKYYENVKVLWKSNILFNLKKNSGNSNEQQNIMKNAGINPSNWDNTFRSFFYSIIQNNPLSESVEKLKYYIKNDFPDLDDLIKASEKCKENVAKNETSNCSKTLQINLENQTREFLKLFVNNFFDSKKQQMLNIDTQIEKVAKNNAIQNMTKSGITKTKCNEIVNALMKKYKENNFTGTINVEEEFQNIKNITLKFNDGTLDPGWKNKMKIIAGNDVIKRAVLSISLLNVSYSIIDIAKKLNGYKQFKEEISQRFDTINRNFSKHKERITILPNDIDEAAKLIQEVYVELKKDRDDIIALIQDINSAINNQKTERNKSIFSLCRSFLNIGFKVFLSVNEKGEKRIEHIKGSIIETFDMGDSIGNIVITQKNIMDLQKKFEEARNLQNNIEEEINKLKQQYENLRTAHYGW